MFWDYYLLFQNIAVFSLVGFSFLLVYIRFHRWMSLGTSFFLVAISIQLYICFNIFFDEIWTRNFTIKYVVNFPLFISAYKSSICVLIIYGALAGKVDLFQMLIISIISLLFFTLN